ncbi:MAG: hypothetical protein ACYDCK_12305 [Thermoplasmatota archaeon]
MTSDFERDCGQGIFLSPPTTIQGVMSEAAAEPRMTITVDLVDRVEAILREERAPMSRNAVLHRLAEEGHSTKRDRLNAAIAHLSKHLVVYDGGSEGVVWLGRPSFALLERLARAKVAR